jgi:anti-sigma factor RsiW
MGDVRPIECERTRRSLSVSLDHELTEFEQALVGAHLERCEPCFTFQLRITDLTAAVRATPLERLSMPVPLPSARRAGWLSAGRLAGAAGAAAVAALAFLGFEAAPDRSGLSGDSALIASALSRPAGTNDLLIDVLRPTLVSRVDQASAYGEDGIGARKPPLEPTV